MRKFYKLFLIALSVSAVFACQKGDDDDSSEETTGIDNTLHLAFKTPDWERKIDCTHLNLDPIFLDDVTYYVSATSASTQETFYFSFPRDSSEMVKPSNIKKHAIVVTGANSSAFEFSQKLPVTAGAQSKLISEAGLSDNSYNEVVEIKYVGVSNNMALFQVKCRYSMVMHEALNETNKKTVTGTFHFKVKTQRK
ncbi:hypothetical protein ACFSJU_19335 [Paradesertivirga mongoliensis]|uniref:Lipoprotein n=1 Tax=Paradesertivirga mongoliensis TaxID=2100740 RepID=A0ABW4ZRA1_9SPHI|nr:hypothetical protein [Pedobacter mongoliensis]